MEYRFDGSELETIPFVGKYKLFVLTSVWLVISHSEEKQRYDGWKNPDGCILRRVKVEQPDHRTFYRPTLLHNDAQ